MLSRPAQCLLLESVVLTFAVVPGHNHDDQTSHQIERGEPRLLGLQPPLHRGLRDSDADVYASPNQFHHREAIFTGTARRLTLSSVSRHRATGKPAVICEHPLNVWHGTI